MEPVVAKSPPETPFTSHVTVVVVEVFELARLTTAVKVAVVFRGTVSVVGEMEMEVTVVVSLFPPQLESAVAARMASAAAANMRTGASAKGRDRGRRRSPKVEMQI